MKGLFNFHTNWQHISEEKLVGFSFNKLAGFNRKNVCYFLLFYQFFSCGEIKLSKKKKVHQEDWYEYVR